MGISKHTPGPWTLELNNHRKEVGDNSFSLWSQGYEFAKLQDESALCGFDDCGYENARLIAAAPDLLKALKECITSDGAACYRLKKEKCRLEAINQIAFAAIAKAEGNVR